MKFKDRVWETRDAVDTGINVDVEGSDITVDEDIDWNAVPTVDAAFVNESHQSFFGTDSFYRFDVTVARSIPQQYTIDDSEYTFLKPTGEIQKASWSLDNTPYVLEHPERGAVTDAAEIRGFFNSSYYNASDESLNTKLTIPTNDSDALEYLQHSSDVSIGFYNTLDPEVDDTSIDAYQRDMYIDHVASVTDGRCSSDDGCKVHL